MQLKLKALQKSYRKLLGKHVSADIAKTTNMAKMLNKIFLVASEAMM